MKTKLKFAKYDLFEKIITAVIVATTMLGFYYARNIYLMAQNSVYDATILTNVLLVLILETLLLVAMLVYSIQKGGSE
jgi:hypothetical protein